MKVRDKSCNNYKFPISSTVFAKLIVNLFAKPNYIVRFNLASKFQVRFNFTIIVATNSPELWYIFWRTFPEPSGNRKYSI